MQSKVNILKNGGVGVMATDTLYGLVGSALNKDTVARIYKIKKRQPEKPFIILISDIKDIKLFNINLDIDLQKLLANFWPGPVSIVLPCHDKKFEYLHRGTQTLAFRLPAKLSLRKILVKTGPLVAPSANPEGMNPAENLEQAKMYFGYKVDFYSSGKTSNTASKIIKLIGNKVQVIRN